MKRVPPTTLQLSVRGSQQFYYRRDLYLLSLCPLIWREGVRVNVVIMNYNWYIWPADSRPARVNMLFLTWQSPSWYNCSLYYHWLTYQLSISENTTNNKEIKLLTDLPSNTQHFRLVFSPYQFYHFDIKYCKTKWIFNFLKHVLLLSSELTYLGKHLDSLNSIEFELLFIKCPNLCVPSPCVW